jgi:hypothetical protein
MQRLIEGGEVEELGGGEPAALSHRRLNRPRDSFRGGTMTLTSSCVDEGDGLHSELTCAGEKLEARCDIGPADEQGNRRDIGGRRDLFL